MSIQQQKYFLTEEDLATLRAMREVMNQVEVLASDFRTLAMEFLVSEMREHSYDFLIELSENSDEKARFSKPSAEVSQISMKIFDAFAAWDSSESFAELRRSEAAAKAEASGATETNN